MNEIKAGKNIKLNLMKMKISRDNKIKMKMHT